MAALVIIACLFVGGITFTVLRISISCMFWFAKNPNDKAQVFKTQFPYFMMVLSGLSAALIIVTNFEPLIFIYAMSTYFLALLIWNFKLKKCKKTYSTVDKITETQNPDLP